MKETTVYLPMPHGAQEVGYLGYAAHEVFDALDAAGVKWTRETPKQTEIRALKENIDTLRRELIEWQDATRSAQDMNADLKQMAELQQAKIAELTKLLQGGAQ